MTVFVRCVDQADKQRTLLNAIHAYRENVETNVIFQKDQKSFARLPGTLISYWAPDSAIAAFERLPELENDRRIARSTNDYGDNMRFVRASWEVSKATFDFVEWMPLCKGGGV